MKIQYTLILSLLVAIPGCSWRSEGKKGAKVKKRELFSEVNIPTAGSGITSYFDEDVNAFRLADKQNGAVPVNSLSSNINTNYDAVEAIDQGKGFKMVFFDFDKYAIRADQKASAQHDAQLIKTLIKESKNGQKPTIVVEGHACHSAGTAAYNLALSERRAKGMRDYLSSCGVPRDAIKIVGRGQEFPLMVNGKKVTGSREEQWPNRRSEVRIVYS